jgi:hypothetical protein
MACPGYRLEAMAKLIALERQRRRRVERSV